MEAQQLQIDAPRFSVEGIARRIRLAWVQSILPALGLTAWVRAFLLAVWSVVTFVWYWVPNFVKSVVYIYLTIKWYRVWIPFVFWIADCFGMDELNFVSWMIPSFAKPAPPPPPKLEYPLLWIVVVVQSVIVVFLILKPNRVLRVCEHGFVVERTVQGSEFVNVAGPDFVGEVWGKIQGRWSRRGTFFRVASKLFTAGHVIQGCDEVRLRYKNQELPFTAKWVEHDLDFVSSEYEPVASWHMGSGKFVETFVPMYVAINDGKQQSYGRLRQGLDVGFVEYDGSTTAGFSGAPYFSGRRILGMHTGSGSLNLGFDAAFMRSVLTDMNRLESMDDAWTDPKELLRQAQEKGDMEYRYMANDFVSVRVNGKYYTMPEEDFNRLSRKGKQTSRPEYEEESNPIPLVGTSQFTYQDAEAVVAEPEVIPENYPRPAVVATPAAGRSHQVATVSVPQKQSRPAPVQSTTPSPKSQKAATPKTTDGQISQAALQSVLSACMSGNSPSLEDVDKLSPKGFRVYQTVLRVKNTKSS